MIMKLIKRLFLLLKLSLLVVALILFLLVDIPTYKIYKKKTKLDCVADYIVGNISETSEKLNKHGRTRYRS